MWKPTGKNAQDPILHLSGGQRSFVTLDTSIVSTQCFTDRKSFPRPELFEICGATRKASESRTIKIFRSAFRKITEFRLCKWLEKTPSNNSETRKFVRRVCGVPIEIGKAIVEHNVRIEITLDQLWLAAVF